MAAAAAVLLVSAVILTGCGGSQATGNNSDHRLNVSIQPKARPGQVIAPSGRAPTLGPLGRDLSKASGVQLDVLNGLRDNTPIFNGDFADPFVLRTSTALFVYASNTTAGRYAPAAHIPVIAVPEASGFEGRYLGDALPTLPKWTVTGFQWAPAVWARPDGTYVMYYSTPATIPLACLANSSAPGCVHTSHGASAAMCISAATSTSPAGPFVDNSSSAFVCPVSQGGAIDPSIFVADDGTPWLLWKSDGDCCGLSTRIYSQQLSPDGLSVVGPAHPLLTATQPWEGGLVEGPSMIEVSGTFWLFYSANLWGTDHYGIGVARCTSVTGPCVKPLSRPWLSSGTGNGQGDQGPGGEEFFRVGGLVWMVHHALAPGQSGNEAQRRLYVDLLAFPTNGQPPRIAQGDASAALAEAVLYNEDPNLPTQPRAAYLLLLHKVPGAFAGQSDNAVVADATMTCHALVTGRAADQIVKSLEGGGLTNFESDLLAILATRYFCPNQALRATADAQAEMLGGNGG
jgi:hypothetical protein